MKIYSKKGELTKYAFCCGYVEEQRTETNYKKMFIEYNCIHVKTKNDWLSFELNDFSKAKKYYKSITL